LSDCVGVEEEANGIQMCAHVLVRRRRKKIFGYTKPGSFIMRERESERKRERESVYPQKTLLVWFATSKNIESDTFSKKQVHTKGDILLVAKV
jgi:hypothetical protein